MTDTDGFAKTMASPLMEQGQKREKKVEENKLEEKQPTGTQPTEDQPGKDVNEQNGQATPKEDPAPQKDDGDDMTLVDEAMGTGLGVNTRGMDGETLTRDELDKKYSEMAAEIGEKAQAKRDATPKATERTEEKKGHNDEISRLENEYRTSVDGDETAAMERVGAKEVLEVPNYREHVTDDQMQGWGRALASFGSVGLKEGSNAIDAATKTLGEFRKLTRAFLSPNPMSPISQAVASTMVGFNTMYDAIDRAGQIAGIKQGADKSIVMETARGAQYYKDKDNATKVANYIMQTFNDQIRDTLGPGGDVTQLNPAQFTRIYGKMKEGFFDSEIERIKHKYSTGQPLSLEDKAIVNGWDNLNKNYHKVLKDKEKTAKEYAKEIGGHERAINALDRQYSKDVKAYDKVIAGIDKDEFNQQKSLGADYTRDLKDLGGKNRTVDAWKAGFDDAVRNKDQVGALIRMTLGPEANRRLRNGNVLLETLKGAQDQANSNATNPNFTPEQQAKWLKIASVFGKRVQTVRNMSVEQRKQYALKLSGTPKTSTNAPKGRSSKGKTLTYTPLMSTKDMQAALNKTSGAYVADKLSGWMDDHRYSVYWGGDSARAGLYNATKDLLKDIYGREYEAYRALGTDKLSGEDLKTRRAELKGLYNKVTDMLRSERDFGGTENPAPEGKEIGADDGPGDEDRKEDRDGPGGQGDDQEEKEQEGYQAEIPHEPSVSTNMEYKSKFTKKYNGMFEDVVNNDESLEAKIEGIDKILGFVNRSLDMGLSEAIEGELRHLRDRLNKQRTEYSKKVTAEFDQNQQEENAKNLKAANEEGPNPEHGETFDADTSIDESKFKNPPEDLRRTDSQKLSKESSGNEIMPKDIPEILRGIWPRGVKTIDGKVHGTGKGNNLNRVLTKAKDVLAGEVKRISALKEGPTDDDITKLTKMRDNLIKTWDWIKDNMKNPSNYEKTRNSTFYGAANPIDDATRLIDGTWTPWKSNDDTNPLPSPDGSTDTGSGETEGQPKNTGHRKRTGKTKTGTGERKQTQEKKQKEKEEKQKGYEGKLEPHYRTLDALKENKEKMSQEDLGKYLGNIRTELFKVLKEMRGQKVSLSKDFKNEFEEKFKEAGPPGHTIEFNWDAKDVSDLIKLTKTPVERIPLGDKIKDPNWNPTEDDKQYIQNHKMQIISTYFDGDEKKAKERFPFLKSAIPPFEELLRAKLNERYGPFTG